MYSLAPPPLSPAIFKLSRYLSFFVLPCPSLPSLFSYQQYFFPFHLDSSIISKDYQELFPQVREGCAGGGKCFRILQQGKIKPVPLQAWNGPEGSRKLRFQDFMTTAQEGGKVVSLTHRPNLPPGNSPGTHLC